jgi:hypothetical protein
MATFFYDDFWLKAHKMKRTFSLIISILLLVCRSEAQVKLSASGGIGIAYNSTRNLDIKYQPIATPHAAVDVAIPLFKKLYFETGLEYVEKGFNSKNFSYVEQRRDEYFGKRRYHYISIPLIASYRIYDKKGEQVWIGGGMNYGIFLKGDAKYYLNSYENGRLVSKSTISYPVGSIWTKSDFLPSGEAYDVYKLDVMMRLQVRYCLNDKYFIVLYHDHSLYDISANPIQGPSSSIKGRYTGISLGITFPD